MVKKQIKPITRQQPSSSVKRGNFPKPKKASASAIRKKTFKLSDQTVIASTQPKKKDKTILISLIVVLIIGMLLGVGLTRQTSCDIAEGELKTKKIDDNNFEDI